MHFISSFLRTLKKHHNTKHTQPEIILITGIDNARGIGNKGELLYHNKIDMEYFKNQTMGFPVVMGSTTYFSIPEKYRPLPGRTNIVLTRDPEKFKGGKVHVAQSIPEVIEQFSREEKIWIIGGASVYKQALSYANTLYITQFFGNKTADTFFPGFKHKFKMISESNTHHDEKESVDFTFQVWKRK